MSWNIEQITPSGIAARGVHCESASAPVPAPCDFCAVAPSPGARARMQEELSRLREASPDQAVAAHLGILPFARPLGFDDGVIFPPSEVPPGTSSREMAREAARRAPLRGSVRVIVVLAQFEDKPLGQDKSHFEDLFFSSNVLPHGSVREYFSEVTNGLIDVVGEVVGPYTLPRTLKWYANNNFGIGRPTGQGRARIMADHALTAADPHVDFGPYDNDDNGHVDAFVVVHAGRGGEQTIDPGDIWSHKWVLPRPRRVDGKTVYAYLTIPDDSRIGVCAHELGHLVFGFPDLYDTDDTSEGVGNWCLMGGGSWNGDGEVPAHPSAWCKVQQGWAQASNVTAEETLTITDVKSSQEVYRLWTNGDEGPEYFLVENRQRSGYDTELPGDGLLIWHIDETRSDNTDENNYMVGLVQSDGLRELERAVDRGDEGDPYPGTTGNTVFDGSSNPSADSYAGQATSISVTAISGSGTQMTAKVVVGEGQLAHRVNPLAESDAQ